ncbi:MAG: polysaccharide lyase [Bacteriovoracaceae bacterium]|nr:polysaccharide lyase [Bacteriovoracaceae bacterium]
MSTSIIHSFYARWAKVFLMTITATLCLTGCQTETDTSYDGNIFGLTGVKGSLTAPRAKKYGFQIARKSDGYPIRSGDSSLRFEVRAGDCGREEDWDDCSNERERNELTSGNLDGEQWIHWSLFLPKDFPNIYPVKTAMGQFHQRLSGKPSFMFQNHKGGYTVDNQTGGNNISIEQKMILTDAEMRGKWSDILVHVNWTFSAENGFFHVYVNGEDMPRYTWFGRTRFDGGVPYFKFGIYRSFVTRRDGPEPTQVVYFDDIAVSSSCSTSTRKFNCTAISQNPPKRKFRR